jgi:hypothetical protein
VNAHGLSWKTREDARKNFGKCSFVSLSMAFPHGGRCLAAPRRDEAWSRKSIRIPRRRRLDERCGPIDAQGITACRAERDGVCADDRWRVADSLCPWC